MRILRTSILLVLIAIIVFFWFDQESATEQQVSSYEMTEKAYMLEAKEPPEFPVNNAHLEGDLYHWIGKTDKELLSEKGEPTRKDLSAYEYVWWVYGDENDSYLQFGIEDGTVQTIYAIGNGLSLAPIEVGNGYEEVEENFAFEEEVDYTDGVATFTFRMTPEDVMRRPLIKLSDEVFAQFYFDTINNELSSVRLLNAEVLLKHQPYEIVYRGMLPKKPDLTDAEWTQVEEGMEQQIFDISNVIRERFNKDELEWEEQVREVAYSHSKDMNDNNYFSHYSLNGDGLKERLEGTGINYVSAGENIAAQYPDAASATEGWLNSESHREALLMDDYTHLGVGVHRFYYTQNFLAKPM